MHRSNLKTAYLEDKMENGLLASDRASLGFREIQTLRLLSGEVGFNADTELTLLDLGCADQFIAPAVKAQRWEYIGLDYTDVDFEVEKLPLESNSVDIAMSLAVIEHLREPENFMAELFRCLKPGGLVYLSTPNFQLDSRNFYNDPTHVRPYTPISLQELLRLHGFESSATFPGLRCKNIAWYRGSNRFIKAYYLLPFRNDTRLPVPEFLKGHARSVFGLARKPLK